jgi:hypothetical protein
VLPLFEKNAGRRSSYVNGSQNSFVAKQRSIVRHQYVQIE